jgi:hypothetical protein
VGVELGPAGFGVVEVPPRQQMEPSQAGGCGDVTKLGVGRSGTRRGLDVAAVHWASGGQGRLKPSDE